MARVLVVNIKRCWERRNMSRMLPLVDGMGGPDVQRSEIGVQNVKKRQVVLARGAFVVG